MTDTAHAAEPFLLASIQFQPKVGEREQNLAAIERLVTSAVNQGAHFVVLPELAVSGYVFADATELKQMAGPVPGGKSALRLIELARDLGIHLVTGIAEQDGENVYNTALLCGPDGYIGKYRKLHLWNAENDLFNKGDLGFPVFETGLGRIGLAICYDGWFPETYRELALAGAELVCVPTNWVPMAGAEAQADAMANILTKAAAHSNGIYIACADRIGEERGQPFIGRSLIVGPDGWPLAGPASPDREEILLARIDLSSVSASRTLNSFNHLLGDRRADVYG